jgi:hypothetical protein
MNNSKSPKENKNSRTLWFIIVILIFFIALFACAGIYVWQSNKLLKKEMELRNEVNALENQIKQYQEKIDYMGKVNEKNEAEPIKETTDSKCNKLVDGSCESETYQTYKNVKLGIKFNYPNKWELKSEKTTGSFPLKGEDSSFEIISVDFERKDNPDIMVNFRRPILETGYETFGLETSNTYNVNGFEIKHNTFQESEEAFENMDLNKEGETFDNKLSLAMINLSSDDFSKTYQFLMITPAENFEEYNKFIIQAISTFDKI